MNVRNLIPLLALMAVLTAAVGTAYAGPVGSEYVPQIPKAGNKHHQSGGGSGSSSSPSGYTPSTTSSAATEPAQGQGKQHPATPKYHLKPKSEQAIPAKPAPVSSSSG